MSFDEYKNIYKYLILLNADRNGWSIYKKNTKVFYLYKRKDNNEKFDLKNDISILHTKPFDVKEIVKQKK